MSVCQLSWRLGHRQSPREVKQGRGHLLSELGNCYRYQTNDELCCNGSACSAAAINKAGAINTSEWCWKRNGVRWRQDGCGSAGRPRLLMAACRRANSSLNGDGGCHFALCLCVPVGSTDRREAGLDYRQHEMPTFYEIGGRSGLIPPDTIPPRVDQKPTSGHF